DDSSALPREAPMEAVHSMRAQYSGIAHDKSLAVVIEGPCRRSPRQEGGLRVVEILQRATPEHRVFSVRCQVIVEPGDNRVVVETDRSPEAEAGIVQAVPNRSIVRIEFPRAECLVEI